MSSETDARPRRQWLLATGAGALALTGCGRSSSLRTQLKHDPAAAQTDVELLNHLLDLEHRAIAAYTAALPLLARPAGRAAKLFLGQEVSHSARISGLVHAAGGKPNPPQQTYDLGRPRSRSELLALLHGVETAQLGAYLDAIPRLSPGSVRATVAAILANDAQHVAVLRSLLGQPPLPGAFVTGAE